MLGMGTLGVGPDIAVQSTTTTNKPSVWDNINNVLTKVVQPAANVYTQVTTKQTPGYIPPSGGAYPPATNQSATMIDSNDPNQGGKPTDWKFIGLVGGGAVLAGTALYFATRKKGKK